jgi:hypothetical protein
MAMRVMQHATLGANRRPRDHSAGREETNVKLASESPARTVRDEGDPMPTTAPMDELLDERLAHRGRTDQDTAAAWESVTGEKFW